MNWAYALGEVLLIVVGVSIALAASSWYNNWKDRLDEHMFISRLHEDTQLAEDLTSRLRDRRLDTLQSLIAASEVIYSGGKRRPLTDKECSAIADSSNFNINISDLPSAAELANTGRMAIIQESELRRALVGMQQIKGTFPLLLYQLEANTTDLSLKYSELIKRDTYLDSNSGEVRIRSRCDEDKMRADQAFVNHLAVNVDQYDVYLRDGLRPWFAQIEKVHNLVHQSLGIQHE
jgi:hypothetical protein